ncbi:MAG: 2-amino-4-hydroxy-6-hydroxymethyldihydropteridine diphosphokinase [Aliishimia sp.]
MSQGVNEHETRGNLPHFRSNALVAAGSNQHSEQASVTSIIDSTLKSLAKLPGAIRSVSTYYQTPCFPEGAGPDFVNAAFIWETDFDAQEILAHLHQTEVEFGRVRTKRWGQRTLDLDLIGLQDTVRPDPQTVQSWIDLPLEQQQRVAPKELILPHPRVQDRAFVLVPLCDIAPDWVHPVLNQSAQQLRDALPQAELDSVKPLVNHLKRQ